MHGHGYAPTPPPGPDQGGQVTLRVIFVVVAVMSCGVLAWACLLRLASVTRRALDWWLFALAIVHIIATLYIIGTDPGEEEFTTWRGDVGMSMLLGGLVAIVAYYLAADIRHFNRARLVPPAYTQTTAYSPQQTVYGYPPAPAPQPQPYAPPPVQHHQTPVPQPPQQQPQPQPAPEAQRPAPARIDQVRAELDELSDYLRKHEGDR
ncbi:hypothetical protein SGFS_050620 [Streptomyces graminofaciens]|uniref:Integral membrane protein n=1 Tax=Streptomyces graminofaciens TaxID=68212 RepID=A0ABM7FCD9_9ACTN|nr:hypothetical protein [Streptomyces graminofaciens]BBC33768.1 hypothetical protein SGFS_050620 [Streptomyces graminofaciens]